MTTRPSPLHRALARAVDGVLDPTVLLSFDQTGFRRHAVSFLPEDLEVDLSGRVVLVTGANSGIGKATARALARRGAQVWMLCRSEARGEQARQELTAETGGDLRLLVVDVADLDSVAAAARALPVPRVDALVHNAGALLDRRERSPQGLEMTLAGHVVGPFALTAHLLPRLERGAGQEPARVIWVSSGGMYLRRLSVERLARVEGPFDGVTAYADAKRAQVVLSELLAVRLRPRGVVSNAMHPGWAATPGVERSLPTFQRVTRRLLRTPEEGADTVVWLAACRRIGQESGRFWFDRQAVSPWMLPGTREAPAERDRLWQAVVAWSGLPAEQVP